MLVEVLGHAEWIMFALVLANQAGAPFAAPRRSRWERWLRTGDVNIGVAVAGATGASLCADLGWYTVGRWRGHRALRRSGASRGTRVRSTTPSALLAHDRVFQLGARFCPS